MSMQVVKLNSTGNFDTWDPSKIDELKKEQTLMPFEEGLLFDNNNMRLWDIRLKPKERLPFHKTEQYYSWTCITDGLAISRNENGSIHLLKFKKGETHYWNLGDNGTIIDFENAGEDMIVIHVIEYIEKPDSLPKNISEYS